MRTVLIAFSTVDGHTKKIAERIGEAMQRSNYRVEMCDLAHAVPQQMIATYDGVIAGGPLHIGKHAPQLVEFVSQNVTTLNEQPSAFFSVSLSAAGTQTQQDDATRCLNEFLEQTHWRPLTTTIVAGALLYRKYGVFKRWLMKLITMMAGGDTDTSKNYEYTDWKAVDQFALELVAQLPVHESRRSPSG